MMIQEKENIENLKKDLEKLRNFLNYKPSRVCKKMLEKIIDYYFKN